MDRLRQMVPANARMGTNPAFLRRQQLHPGQYNVKGQRKATGPTANLPTIPKQKD